MAKSTPRKPVSEEARPFPHNGYWKKKCRGKLVYLGKIADDPDGDQLGKNGSASVKTYGPASTHPSRPRELPWGRWSTTS